MWPLSYHSGGHEFFIVSHIRDWVAVELSLGYWLGTLVEMDPCDWFMFHVWTNGVQTVCIMLLVVVDQTKLYSILFWLRLLVLLNNVRGVWTKQCQYVSHNCVFKEQENNFLNGGNLNSQREYLSPIRIALFYYLSLYLCCTAYPVCIFQHCLFKSA